MELVWSLQSASLRDVAAVGTKAATLGELVAAGFAVPEGLILTTAASDRARPGTGPLPADVAAAVGAIAGHFGDALLAVRSSAVEEDSPDASYAGQFETILNVRGGEALLAAVRRCWASARGDRVESYRAARGGAAAPLAVLVQRQVEADVAGVAFTADPVTGTRGDVLVSAVPGLGDVVAGGTVQPDEWRVRDGHAMPVLVRHQALAERQVQAIAALALRIQELRGAPQDVEWAMAGGRLIVLQARPITALPQPPQLDVPPGTWIKEGERHPEPLTAFGASLAAPIIARGLTVTFAEFGALLERMEARSIGGEPYVRPVPIGGRDGPPPPWWLLAILARAAPPLRRRMRAARRMTRPEVLEGLLRRWDTEWRPRFRDEAARLRAVDLASLSDAELAGHFDRVRAIGEEAMGVHFRLIVPYVLPLHDLVTLCGRLLGWPQAEALSLLAGTSQSTLEPLRAMSVLAEDVRRNPAALAAVQHGADDLGERLAAADPALGAAFAAWCEHYAYRNVNDDPGSPLLAELPWLLAGLLRDAVRSDERAADRAAGERARAELAARPGDLGRFEQALARARRAYPVREDTVFWAASVFGGCMRSYALEAGRRLAARGELDRAEDAVHLTAESLRAALAGGSDAAPGGVPARRGDPGRAGVPRPTLREQARRARAEREWMRQHPGPAVRGPAPHPPPDIRCLPRAGRRLNAAMLWAQSRGPVAPEVGGDAAVAGAPASAGRHTGPVRVVAGPDDFGKLRPGDVLVCPSTAPAWTVLFGTAGALVTDAGGVLSHAAIVAREYAVPAVVGTGNATSMLRDGQIVTVDGDRGHVLLTPAAREPPLPSHRTGAEAGPELDSR